MQDLYHQPYYRQRPTAQNKTLIRTPNRNSVTPKRTRTLLPNAVNSLNSNRNFRVRGLMCRNVVEKAMLWFQSVKAGHSRVLRGMNHRPATLLGDTWCPQRGGKYGPLIWTLSPFRGNLGGPLRAHVASMVGA